MAKKTSKRIATGLLQCLEALEQHSITQDAKSMMMDYINKAIAATAPNFTYFTLTLWPNEELEQDGKKYRANVLVLDFQLRKTSDLKEEPYTGQCAFELSATNYIRSLVICYDPDDEQKAA